MPLHVSFLWNSKGALADEANALRIRHREEEILLVLGFLFGPVAALIFKPFRQFCLKQRETRYATR